MQQEEKSNTPETEMTIGQYLRSKREEKGLSLKVISQQTKIHIGLLENLEANQFDKLPSKAYVRGFVKSTSKILGLDQDYALALLENAYQDQNFSYAETANPEMRTESIKNTLSPTTTTPLDTVKAFTSSSGIFIAKLGIGALLITIIGINVKNFIDRAPEEPAVKLPEVLTTLQKKKAPAPKPAPTKVAESPATPEEPLKINIIQDKNVKPNSVVVNDVNLNTISLGEKQFTPDNSITADRLDELFPPKYRVQVIKGTETLFINASEGDSWLTYKVDDKEIKKFVLRQGRTLFLRGNLIRIFVGNAKSLKMFYNNKPVVPVTSPKSTLKNIVLPEEMKTKYMAPLFVFQDDGSVITSDEFVKANQDKKDLGVGTPKPTATGPSTIAPGKEQL